MSARKISRKRIIILSIVWIFLSVSSGYAQNFVGIIPKKEKNDDAVNEELLRADEMRKVLAAEGVPLVPNYNIENTSTSKYTLGPEDIIEVVVLRHPEVSGQYIINMEGKIQYEFVGDVEVAGMTKTEVSEALEKELSKFIISPEVMVKIIGYNSKVVYVVGEVARPGKVFMRGDTITIREALIQAALPLLTAKASKSSLITPSADGKPKVKKVNVHKLLYEGDLRENLVMKPGDILYIPPTIMAKAFRAIQPIAQPIGTAAGTGRVFTTGF